jgi:hypothetical protein
MKISQTTINHAAPVAGGLVPRLAIALVILLLAVTPAPLPADTAEGPPEGVLWTSLVISAPVEPNSGILDFLALGFDAEYGILPWASLDVNWRPGYLLSGYQSPDPAGSFSDFRLFFRFGLLGDRGLIRVKPLRLALIAGVDIPFPSEDQSLQEPDLHLWGLRGGLSLDYIPHPFFQVNLSGFASYYPEQASDNPAFLYQAVSHPLEIRAEAEPRFNYLVPSGLILTLPVVYEYSAESSVRGQALDDEGHLLSVGFGYTIAVHDPPLPFEVGVRYLVPVYDINRSRRQRLELTGKVMIPLKQN